MWSFPVEPQLRSARALSGAFERRCDLGNAVALEPNCPYLFLAHIVIEDISRRKDRKCLFNLHLYNGIDRILPALPGPQTLGDVIELGALREGSRGP